MSLCRITFFRCASVALVLAIVLIAMPAFGERTNDSAQRANCTVG